MELMFGLVRFAAQLAGFLAHGIGVAALLLDLVGLLADVVDRAGVVLADVVELLLELGADPMAVAMTLHFGARASVRAML